MARSKGLLIIFCLEAFTQFTVGGLISVFDSGQIYTHEKENGKYQWAPQIGGRSEPLHENTNQGASGELPGNKPKAGSSMHQ